MKAEFKTDAAARRYLQAMGYEEVTVNCLKTHLCDCGECSTIHYITQANELYSATVCLYCGKETIYDKPGDLTADNCDLD